MDKPVTLADIREHIRRRIAELDPEAKENGPDYRLLDPNGFLDMLSERAVHKELTEVLALLDRLYEGGVG